MRILDKKACLLAGAVLFWLSQANAQDLELQWTAENCDDLDCKGALVTAMRLRGLGAMYADVYGRSYASDEAVDWLETLLRAQTLVLKEPWVPH